MKRPVPAVAGWQHTMSQSTDEEREPACELSESDRHRLLASERRRVALEVLEERTTLVALGDLAEAVADRETATGAPDDETVRCVALSLHHHHLPMMADLGVVDYDHESRHVA